MYYSTALSIKMIVEMCLGQLLWQETLLSKNGYWSYELPTKNLPFKMMKKRREQLNSSLQIKNFFFKMMKRKKEQLNLSLQIKNSFFKMMKRKKEQLNS